MFQHSQHSQNNILLYNTQYTLHTLCKSKNWFRYLFLLCIKYYVFPKSIGDDKIRECEALAHAYF